MLSNLFITRCFRKALAMQVHCRSFKSATFIIICTRRLKLKIKQNLSLLLWKIVNSIYSALTAVAQVSRKRLIISQEK